MSTEKLPNGFWRKLSRYKAYLIPAVTALALLIAVFQGQAVEVLKHWYQSLTGVNFQQYETIHGYDYAREVVKDHLARHHPEYKQQPALDDEITHLKKSDAVWHYRFNRGAETKYFRLQQQHVSANGIPVFHIVTMD